MCRAFRIFRPVSVGFSQAAGSRQGKQLLSTAPTTKRLYFGIPVGAAEFWIDVATWPVVRSHMAPSAPDWRGILFRQRERRQEIGGYTSRQR